MKSLIKNIQHNSSRILFPLTKSRLINFRNIFNPPYIQRLIQIPRVHFSELKNSSTIKLDEVKENNQTIDNTEFLEKTDAQSSPPKDSKVNNDEEISKSKEKLSLIDEIEKVNEVNEVEEMEEEDTSFAIDEMEKDDAEYKYIYKTINSKRSTLKNLLKLSQKNSKYFRENIMFIAIEFNKNYKLLKNYKDIEDNIYQEIFNDNLHIFLNVSVEDAFPTFYLFFLMHLRNVISIDKKIEEDILNKAKNAIFSNNYGLSEIEKFILFGFLSRKKLITDRKKVDILTKNAIKEGLSFNNMKTFLTCLSYWDIDHIANYKILNLVLNKFEEKAKHHSRNRSLVAAEIISKIQMKFYIKGEFDFLIRNLLIKWMNNDLNKSNIFNLFQIFSNVDRDKFRYEMNNYFSMIKDVKDNETAKYLVKFLSKLDTHELDQLSQTVKDLLVNIEEHKIYEVKYDLREYFMNLVILMNKSTFQVKIFQLFLSKYYNNLSPIQVGSIEAVANLIQKCERKERFTEIIAKFYSKDSNNFSETLDQIIILKYLDKENFKAIIDKKFETLLKFQVFDVFPHFQYFIEVQKRYLNTEEINKLLPRFFSSDISGYLLKLRVRDLYKNIMYIIDSCPEECHEHINSALSWFISKNNKLFFYNFHRFINQDLEVFSKEIIVKNLPIFIDRYLDTKNFLSYQGNFFSLLNIVNDYLVYNSNKSFNMTNYEPFKQIVEYIDKISPNYNFSDVHKTVAINIFVNLSDLNINSKFITAAVIDNLNFVYYKKYPMDYEQFTALTRLSKTQFEECKNLLQTIFSDVDYLISSLTPFTLEIIFNLSGQCNKKKLISNGKCYEILAYTIEEARSKRYKNKFSLISLLNDLPQEMLIENYDFLIGEFIQIFQTDYFPDLIENLSHLNLEKLDKDSISRKISVEILLNAYKHDSKPSPLDLGRLFELLKKINCKDPSIFKEIMNKYDFFYDIIKVNKIHLNYLYNIGQEGKIDFKVEPVWKKIKGFIEGLKLKDKTKIFCNLVMSNYLNTKDIGFLITIFRLPNMKSSNLIELYTYLICLYKLSCTHKGKVSFEKEITNLIKQMNSKELESYDQFVNYKNKANMAIVGYLHYYDLLNDLNKQNIKEGLNIRNDKIKSSTMFQIVESILTLLNCKIVLFPYSVSCNILNELQNLAIFVLEEEQRKILKPSEPDFCTSLCIDLSKIQNKKIILINEQDMRALFKNEEMDVEDIKNAFSLKYGIERNRESLERVVDVEDEKRKLRNLFKKFIKTASI